MTDLSFSFPPAMLDWLEQRVARGDSVDMGDYLRDLIRREQEEARKVEWLRDQITEGEASGIIDKEPEDVIEEIIAARRARND
jgi:antitoxin ParD1/3/4